MKTFTLMMVGFALGAVSGLSAQPGRYTLIQDEKKILWRMDRKTGQLAVFMHNGRWEAVGPPGMTR